MVTFAAGAVIFLVAWWALRIPNTNIASEIAENGGLQGTGEVAIGASRPLIPEVLLTIIHVRWSDAVLLTRPQSRSYPRRSVGPINPDFRFLVVDYEIDNGSDDWLTRKGLTDLLRVMGSGGPSFHFKGWTSKRSLASVTTHTRYQTMVCAWRSLRPRHTPGSGSSRQTRGNRISG